MLHGLQLAGLRIDSEHRDGVMAAIGAVQKLTTWMHLHFRRTHALDAFLRQRGDRLQFIQLALPFVPTKGGDRQRDFVDHVTEFAVWMKCKMTRTCAGRHLGKSGRRQRTFLGVEPVDQHLVQTEISSHGKFISGRHIDRVPMRRTLARQQHTGPCVLHKRTSLA